MNDSKNKTDTCGLPACQPVHEPRRRACLAFACLVCRALRCGDLGPIFARIQHFRVACLALRLGASKCASLGSTKKQGKLAEPKLTSVASPG